MNSQPHRQNSNFGLRYFLAGSCKTPDGAYSLMYGQKISMESKIAGAESQRLTMQAKIMAAQEIIEDSTSKPSAKLKAQADILEVNGEMPVWEMNLKAAKNELETINKLMNELEPLRKYSNLSILEANEESQREEWLEELKERAENFLITTGTIPHDHLSAMRNHPDFQLKIIPHIKLLIKKMSLNVGYESNLDLLIEYQNSLLKLESK